VSKLTHIVKEALCGVGAKNANAGLARPFKARSARGGGPAFETALRCLASEGRLVVIGFASGQVGTLSAGVALGKNIDLIACYWGAYRDADADRIRRAYDELARWVESGKLNPHVAARVPLAEAPRALALMGSRTLAGKIVLVP
jgi:NADPH:quinone reductase